jgi:Na+/H+ antiporter NhaC
MVDYGLLSLLPPALTVVLAIWTRNILLSLGFGVFSGSLILTGYNPFAATLDMIEQRVFVQIAVPSNIQIIFTMMAIGGFIKLLEESGGAKAFASGTTKFISNSNRAQLSTWLSGLSIFFTDSGNALIIGPLFRPIFRELKICKEKLAYILDSTASPICILIPFIGWGAYIMGLIEQSYADSGLTEQPLSVLVNVIPYQFYAILTLVAVPIFIFSGRDFGPMRRAQETFNESEISEIKIEEDGDDDSPLSLFVVPLTLLLGIIAGLLSWYAMRDELTSIHVRSTMTIGYVVASIACGYLMFKHKKIPVNDSLMTFIKGAETMVFVVTILILAWSLSSVIKDLGTAVVLSKLLSQSLNPMMLPALVFLLGAVISLATGSSWGTFAILMSLAIPVAHTIDAPMYLTVAAVLSGGLFGDHTSPISDTTVLASIGADCAHINHVNTQFYYAILTGSVAFVTYLFAGMFQTPYIIIPALVLLYIVIRLVNAKFGAVTIPDTVKLSV